MKVKAIIDEDFINYKKPSMMIAMCYCDWKCLLERNLSLSICQNHSLSPQKDIEIPIDSLVDRYLKNPITQAIVIAGLEPMLQFSEVYEFIKEFRKNSSDDIVIYTGYYENEIQEQLKQLQEINNIIIKFGRFIPDSDKRYDDVLGVWLASDNQYAVKIS
jgi:pyruvate-formate lyase-activating enzyme